MENSEENFFIDINRKIINIISRRSQLVATKDNQLGGGSSNLQINYQHFLERGGAGGSLKPLREFNKSIRRGTSGLTNCGPPLGVGLGQQQEGKSTLQTGMLALWPQDI